MTSPGKAQDSGRSGTGILTHILYFYRLLMYPISTLSPFLKLLVHIEDSVMLKVVLDGP